jgi:plasmid stabilization system protein ParE
MYSVVLLAKAEEDLDRITGWLTDRSPSGAARWLAAFHEIITRLEDQPGQFSVAPESEYVREVVRQGIFSTPRGLP